MTADYNTIMFSQIYGELAAISKLDYELMVNKTYILVTFYLKESEERSKRSLIQLLYYFFFELMYYFCPKNAAFFSRKY